MKSSGYVSVKQAVRLLQSGHRAIHSCVKELGITLEKRGRHRYMRLADMDRIGEWLMDRPKRAAMMQSYAAQRNPTAAERELAARIAAARRLKAANFGLPIWLDAVLEDEVIAAKEGGGE